MTKLLQVGESVKWFGGRRRRHRHHRHQRDSEANEKKKAEAKAEKKKKKKERKKEKAKKRKEKKKRQKKKKADEKITEERIIIRGDGPQNIDLSGQLQGLVDKLKAKKRGVADDDEDDD